MKSWVNTKRETLTLDSISRYFPSTRDGILSRAVSLRLRHDKSKCLFESVNAINDLSDYTREEWTNFCVEHRKFKVVQVENKDNANLKSYAHRVTPPYDGSFPACGESSYYPRKGLENPKVPKISKYYIAFIHRPIRQYLTKAWEFPARWYFSDENATLALAVAQEIATWELEFIKSHWLRKWGLT